MPERPAVGTPVHVTRAAGDPWPGTAMPSRRLPADQVNVLAHPGGLFTAGAVVTVRLDQLDADAADAAVLEQAREVLRRHHHGIHASCTPACSGDQPPADEVPPCPRCRSTEWVSVSLDGGWTRKAQCVPCGHVQPKTIGPGWKAGG